MKRLQALDVMRGITIALMILVNTALWGTPVYPQLQHSLWNGLTAADLVFPLFMFMMGVSAAYSLRRFDYRPTAQAVKKVVRRTLLIYLIGLLLDLAEKGLSGAISGLDFSTLRLTGVLPRLAFSYGLAALLALWLPLRTLAWIIAALLGGYAAVLLTLSGYEPTEHNVVARVDLALFGPGHIYHDWVPGGRIALDPEGLLGLIPSVAHVLIGYLCGRAITDSPQRPPLRRIIAGGALLLAAGLLLHHTTGLYINKKVWSPTFVLTCCGAGSIILAALIWLLDLRHADGPWTEPAKVFGANPLLLYIISSLLGCALWAIPVAGTFLPEALYTHCLLPAFGPHSALPSLLYALAVTTLCYLLGLPLYRHHLHLKI